MKQIRTEETARKEVRLQLDQRVDSIAEHWHAPVNQARAAATLILEEADRTIARSCRMAAARPAQPR